MWYHPPEPSRHQNTAPASPDPYFLLPFFLWAPQRFWGVQFSCNEECQANQRAKGSKVWIVTVACCIFFMKVFYANAMLIITALDTPSDTVRPIQDREESAQGQHLVLHGNWIPGVQGLQEKICRMVSPRPETTGHGETQPFPGSADIQVVYYTHSILEKIENVVVRK